MAEYHRLQEQKYSKAEYLFKTIEMAKSDEEYNDIELCTTPPPSSDILNINFEPMHVEGNSIFPWNFVRRRFRRRRFNTVHGNAPPAPPSTPTSLTASSTPTQSPTVSSNNAADDEPLNSLLYILDYAPKYKKKLKEQQRTDADLAELFKLVTITGGSTNVNGGKAVQNVNGGNSSALAKVPTERGISATSRVIRKHDACTKIFKIHRNTKEFLRDPDEDDSVSAPEYNTEEEDICQRRLERFKKSFKSNGRLRRIARFEHEQRMETMVENFDVAMSLNNA